MPELLPFAPLTPEWHAARRGGVTATDIVTILGLSSWDSPYSLFWRKMQQIPEQPERDRLELGKALEPYIVQRWGEANQDTLIAAGGLYRSSARAWQLATLDAQVGPALAPLELKSWADADKHSWGAECGGQGQPCDHVPARVRAQVLWQMDVMDVAAGHVGVVFLPSGEFRSYEIVHGATGCVDDGEVVCVVCLDQELMRRAGEEFMARLRLELPPPDPDSSAATLAAVRARFTRQPDKEGEVSPQTYEAWVGARTEMDRYEAEARWLESLLREQAGEASVLTVGGVKVARRVIVDAQVKAHVRHQDYLKRIKQGDDDAADA